VSYETVITAGDVVYEELYLTSSNVISVRASYVREWRELYSIALMRDDDSLYYRQRLCWLAVNTGYTTYEVIDSVQAFSTPTKF
jgi:hypothetical protein